MAANDNEAELQRYRRIMDTGEGEGRGVYVGMLRLGHDAILAEIVVYGLAEGFARAAGTPPGNYMRFHEHLERHTGAALPPGLTADALRATALALLEDDGADFDGCTIDEIEEKVFAKGARLHAAVHTALAPACDDVWPVYGPR